MKLRAKWCAKHQTQYPTDQGCLRCQKEQEPVSAAKVSEPVVEKAEALPDANPKTRAGGSNKVPLHLVPPSALAHMAMAFADGGLKYQPYNWRSEPISASVYYGAAMRHLVAWWDGEDVAVDSGVHHLAHVMACCAMVLDTCQDADFNDNRPPAGRMPELLERLANRLPGLKERETTRYELHDLAKRSNRVLSKEEIAAELNKLEDRF